MVSLQLVVPAPSASKLTSIDLCARGPTQKLLTLGAWSKASTTTEGLSVNDTLICLGYIASARWKTATRYRAARSRVQEVLTL